MIEFDVIADNRRLTNDDAGAMVDEEIFPYLRARVDVNAGLKIWATL